MSKQKALSASTFVGEIFHFGLYKPSQGRITRQVTCAAIWIVCFLAAARLYQTLYDQEAWMQYGMPFAVLVIGFWAGYRLVNYPKFADFLIAVEAEMNKVSWPSRGELLRSSFVVIFVIFFLAAVLYLFDAVWQIVFQYLGVLITK
jgi:preprotein translocase subunit SecE